MPDVDVHFPGSLDGIRDGLTATFEHLTDPTLGPWTHHPDLPRILKDQHEGLVAVIQLLDNLCETLQGGPQKKDE